jgi:uncharacterized membrane protein
MEGQIGEQNFSTDRFKLGKKWFWIGLVIAIINMLSGLIYGIALTLEKDRRKEGIFIFLISILWFIFASYFLSPWLTKKGVMSHVLIVK